MIGDRSLRGRVVRAVGAGLLGQGLNVFARLLIIPLYIAAWGPEVYGKWIILSSAVSILMMSDMGGQVYYVNQLTTAREQSNSYLFNQILTTGIYLLTAFPALFILIMLVFIKFMGTPEWAIQADLGSNQTFVVVFVLTLQVLIALPQGLLLGVYRAIGEQATSVMLANLMLVLQTVLTATALYLDCSPTVVALLQIFPFFIISIFAVAHLRFKNPQIKFVDYRYFSQKIAWESVKPSLNFFSIQLAQLSLQQVPILIIARFLGPVEVTIFSIIRAVLNSAKQVTSVLSHSTWPEFTRLDARGEENKLGRLFYSITCLSLLFALFVASVVEMGGDGLMTLWLGSELDYPADIVRAYGVYILLSILSSAFSSLLMATNRHSQLAKYSLAIAVATSLSFYLGVREGGLLWGVFSLILVEALMTCLVSGGLLVRENIGIKMNGLLICTVLLLMAIILLLYVPAVTMLISICSTIVLLKYIYFRGRPIG